MKKKVFGIGIIGKEDFCQRTEIALRLLKDKDNFNFRRVKRFIKLILEDKISGMDTANKVFHVGRKTAFSSGDPDFDIIWYSSCIMHDAIHSEVDRRFRGGKDAIQSWEVVEWEEKLCLKLQRKCLKKIGATNQHFAYLDAAERSEYWKKDRTW